MSTINGPRTLSPAIVRNDYFAHHDYTLRIAQAVDIHLTDRQARDLWQQLNDEFKPATAVFASEPVGLVPTAEPEEGK